MNIIEKKQKRIFVQRVIFSYSSGMSVCEGNCQVVARGF